MFRIFTEMKHSIQLYTKNNQTEKRGMRKESDFGEWKKVPKTQCENINL